ncbi:MULTISPECIES: alpha/beta hydrolase [Chryseobacterium]|uniref:Acetyl esterase/lipase n=1 Tax=Chryseobacterium camelliae TaxID=1265445 RepID=A0ABU0TIH7_9FLAO|nr:MULTISPECIES: alpha/beta hydrolase [Chryseobacterium]MDT3409271.1 acetyl esterase/lipase [Pseudacidovorax intermedius]MDQ1096866.1 acetyl esterase/lipase [Chryseobacterium camelliae]MDQ1100808.1 acetyl esterase/lipase [Chryseobacterium sp. SORGH_AS_1048]MDR6084250.1 acetyl esterase/lipase [Chryseobacterium sp. SORGH_AS_0909]MDR6132523.1 acetyl esterase/lipase [Chryseobacterium sp. SORGH_AS_1175]
MKKFINLFFAVILMIILLLCTLLTLSVYLKWPMYVSGYSSLFETQFNSRFILLALVLCIIAFLYFKKQDTGKKIWKFNLILGILFLAGQLIFMLIMLRTATRYDAKVSVITSLKGYEKPIRPNETHHYLTIYNEKQLFDVYRPANPSGKPTIPVVLVHGGAFIEGKRDQLGYAANWFTQRGYTSFGIEYPLAKKDRQTYESAVNSVATCMSYIRKHAQQFNIDPSKMILVGGSAGGGLVMQADIGLRDGVVHSYDGSRVAPPAAVIALYPPVSLSDLYQKLREGKTVDLYDPMNKYMGGSPAQFPERFRQLNLIDHLSEGISPTLILTGEIDHVVNVEAIRNFVKKSRELKLPVTYVEMPYGEHAYDANPNSIAGQMTWAEITAFLKRNHLAE